MLRRLIAPLMALTLLGGACSSTTVISDGMLETASDDAVSPATPEDSTSDTEPVETDEPDEAETDPETRGDRDLGDTEDSQDTEDAGGTGDAQTEDTTTDDRTDGDLGFGLGSDDQLASLVTDCEAGSDMACDILYSTSPVDSDEELLALTCGGRSDFLVDFCTEGIESSDGNFWFAEASPGLPAALASCEDGNMTACDFLYFRSEIGSDYEEVGNTCGGRTAVAIPDCRTAQPPD